MKKGTYLMVIFFLAFLLSIAGIGNASNLVNDGFETGDLTGWATGTVSDFVGVVGDDYPFASPNGNYMCRLGKAYYFSGEAQNPGPNEISQTFMVTEPELDFAYCLFTYDYGGYDDFHYKVTIEDGSGTIIYEYQQGAWGSEDPSLKNSGWQDVDLDVSGYMDQSLTIYFTAGGTVDMMNGFWAYIDNEPGGVHTPEPGEPASLGLDPSYQDIPIGNACSINAYVYDEYGIGVPDVPVMFLVVSGPNVGISGSGVTDDYGGTSFSYLGNTVGLDTINVWCDMDGDGDWDPEDIGNVANVNWLDPNLPADFGVDPQMAAPPVGNEHSIQAMVGDVYGMPMVGVPIMFQIVSGPHIGTTYAGITDDAGIVSFSYMGIASGVDVVQIWCDMNGNGVWDPSELGSYAYTGWLERLRAIKYNWGEKPVYKKPFYSSKLFSEWVNPTVVPPEIPPEFGIAYNVTALISKTPGYVTVNDGEITIGTVVPGTSVWSIDTFGTTVDTSKPSNPKDMIFFDVMYYDYFGNMHIITDVPQF